ncbi:MAG: family ATPase, partial [Mucilaginibacter sp.]|nr:family ATPase [Mucilaginibacter sp.]
QPNQYTSQARLATGIADQTQKVIIAGIDPQESKINQDFSNLIEMIRSKRNLDQLAYKLIIHDLTNKEPYRKPSKLFSTLNASARHHALLTYTELYNKRQPLSLFNADQNGLYRLLVSMEYDDQSILKMLSVYRVQSSDYIDVQFDSENSDLSAVVVNTLCSEFINYYTLLMRDNQKKALDFWKDQLQAKQDTLNVRMASLKAYKIKNHVLNLDEKAKSLYGQIADFETRREEVQKNIQATRAAINNIDKQFDPTDRKYFESSKVAISQQILSAKSQLQNLNDEYVQSNFNPKYKLQIDSLNKVVSGQIQQLSDKYVLNPLSTKESMVDQKLALQIQNELAKHSTESIDKELSRLNTEFNALVPHEGTIQVYENAITVATQEYLENLQKYNQTNVTSKLSTQLRVVDSAEPGILQPSKKMLLVIISGLVSFVFCILVLFVLFFFDNTIKTPVELANRTKLPVLGYANLLSNQKLDLKEVWNNASGVRTKQLRNLIQSLRFEIDNALANDKILLITSLEKAEGKTFIATNLAYAYASINKTVLLIDGNFYDPGITKFTQTKYYLEDFLNDKIDDSFLSANTKIKILGNHGQDMSILEITSKENLIEKFERLKANFDMILIEASSLDTLNKSKEWMLVADKILTVFEAGKNINENHKQNIAYLESLNGKFIGWTLNLVRPDQRTAEND